MPKVKIVKPQQFINMPWRNGLGTTTELAKESLAGTPETDFIWRLSMASVVADGEFSNFEGYNRCLILLSGNGLTLHYGNNTDKSLTEILQMAEFQGDDPTSATLHDGPITDFNIMTQRACCYAEVMVSTDAATVKVRSAAAPLMVYAPQGELCINAPDAAQVSVPLGSLAILDSAPPGNYQVTGAPFIAVQIVKQRPAV